MLTSCNYNSKIIMERSIPEMKKKSVFLPILLTFTLLFITGLFNVSADEAKDGDKPEKEYQFRGYKWLTPYDEIKENETKDIVLNLGDYYTTDTEEEKSFAINTTVSGLDSTAGFLFNDDWELTMGIYQITTEHATQLDYYSDFTILQEALHSLYGEPTYTDQTGLDDIDLSNTQDLISGILDGGQLNDYWISNDLSGIMLVCRADEGTVRPGLIYFQSINDLGILYDKLSAPNTDGL